MADDSETGGYVLHEPATFGEDMRIGFPDPVREAIAEEHPLHGESVYWNYDEHTSYVILSSGPLGKDGYVEAERTKVYEPSDAETRATVRAPDSLGVVAETKFFPGSDCLYLAREEMVTDDNPAVFLLTTSEFTELLPPDATADVSGDGGVDRFLANPGLLPSI